MSTLIATFSGAVQQFNGIPASEKAVVIHDLRKDAQTVSNAQVATYLKGKNEPAPLAEMFVQFNQEARDKGLQNALIAISVLGLFGFVMSCFLPGGRSKKKEEAAEAEPNAPPAPASS
jgi:hypothetical protein